MPKEQKTYSPIRNRIKDFRTIMGSEIRANPKNHRRHPTEQTDAIRGVLQEVGIANALVVYEAGDGIITLIDGECRQTNFQNVPWPCIVLDVSDEEADYLLATHDALGGLAQIDQDALSALLANVSTSFEGVQNLLDSMMITEDAALSSSKGIGEIEDIAYKVLVTCRDEQQQAELIERLEEEGLECQPLML